jgi:sugar lactone lactonase YvrE
MTLDLHDDRTCQLGEGPLWHPERKQLFWFDILTNRLLTRTPDGPQHWTFDEPHSAAGWIDRDTLLIASSSGLWRFGLSDGVRTPVVPLEKTNAVTRSNDGRADPWGGFWIGTMGRAAEPRAGGIYRLYQGVLRKLFSDITISNSICFAPGRGFAYYSDTFAQRVMRVPLDRNGWPTAAAEVLIDLRAENLNPDGAVTDRDGTLWIALWGASRIAAYTPDGRFKLALPVPALQPTCPALGGADFATMFVTSAAHGALHTTAGQPAKDGMTFAIADLAQGLPEPKVQL